MDARVKQVQPPAFESRFTAELPADPRDDNQPRQVPGACYSRVRPAGASAPVMIAWCRELAEALGLDPAWCATREFTEVMAGNRLLEGMDPYATCYGGHQFGRWAGQLGDGRVVNLGELVDSTGRRQVLQLKGAGPTPYRRGADGYAVLRSSVREFLVSEAMHHLGVPTTRALALVATGDSVVRDMFYDGRPAAEPGAVVCRVAPSFTRFGSFEIFAARGDIENLRRLAEYTLRVDFEGLGEPSPQAYRGMFEEVCRRTADLMVEWMRVGFVHGVMNTDNMSMLGLTIDYGPYGWLEGFDPGWTPNTTDAGGRRYCFGRQPQIAGWNLMQLANALYPLIEDGDALQAALDDYGERFERGWSAMMARKLGLERFEPERDGPLVDELLECLQAVETDMTIFFRRLADLPAAGAAPAGEDVRALLGEAYYRPEEVAGDVLARMTRWVGDYRRRLQADGVPAAERRARMNRVNPKYVLRNYLAQLAIDDAERGDFARVHELMELLRRPYDEQPERQAYAAKRPEWARHKPGCSMLSCSS